MKKKVEIDGSGDEQERSCGETLGIDQNMLPRCTCPAPLSFTCPLSLPPISSNNKQDVICENQRPCMVFTPRRAPVVHVDNVHVDDGRGGGVGTIGLREEIVGERGVGLMRRSVELEELIGLDGGEEIRDGGSGVSRGKKNVWWLGRKHTIETKVKIGLANRGRVPWNRGKEWSEDVKRRISLGTQRAMRRPEVVARLRLKASLRRHDKVSRERIRMGGLRAAAKRRDALIENKGLVVGGEKGARVKLPFPLEGEVVIRMKNVIERRIEKYLLDKRREKERVDKRIRNGPMTEVTKEKLRQKIKAMWADPEYRARVEQGRRNSPRATRRKLTMEHREKISLTLRQRNAEEGGIPRKSRSPESYYRPKRVKTEEELEQQRLERLRKAEIKKAQAELQVRRLKREEKIEQLRAAKRRQREAERVIEQQEGKILFKNLKDAGVLPPLEDDGDEKSFSTTEKIEGTRELSSYRLFNSLVDAKGIELTTVLKFNTYTHKERVEQDTPKNVRRVVTYVNGEEIIEEEEVLST